MAKSERTWSNPWPKWISGLGHQHIKTNSDQYWTVEYFSVINLSSMNYIFLIFILCIFTIVFMKLFYLVLLYWKLKLICIYCLYRSLFDPFNLPLSILLFSLINLIILQTTFFNHWRHHLPNSRQITSVGKICWRCILTLRLKLYLLPCRCQNCFSLLWFFHGLHQVDKWVEPRSCKRSDTLFQ